MLVGLLGISVSSFVFVVLVFIVLLVFILVKVYKYIFGNTTAIPQLSCVLLVKSVDLDTWVQDQVENMVRWGNERANK